MKKQCVNCRYSNNPRHDSACNHRVKWPMGDYTNKMRYNLDGSSYCDGFKPTGGAHVKK
jgi:hypothetical protein